MYERKDPLEEFSPRFFGDQDGMLLIGYLPKGQTINAEYYSSLPVKLKDILKAKSRVKVIKGVLFLHDNAPAHQALATQKKLAYLRFQCLDHPPCSPDIALGIWLVGGAATTTNLKRDNRDSKPSPPDYK